MFATAQKTLRFNTGKRKEILDITTLVEAVVAEAGVRNGTCTIFSRHTTLALRVNEYEPLLLKDAEASLDRMAPSEYPYQHDRLELRPGVPEDEPLNGDAHIQHLHLDCEETVPVVGGVLNLGSWQRIWLLELDGPRTGREVTIMVQGDSLNGLDDYRAEVFPLLEERGRTLFPGVTVTPGQLTLITTIISDGLNGDRVKALQYAAILETFHAATGVWKNLDGQSLQVVKTVMANRERAIGMAYSYLAGLPREEYRLVVDTARAMAGGALHTITTDPLETIMDLVTGRAEEQAYAKVNQAQAGAGPRAAATLGVIAAHGSPHIKELAGNYGEELGIIQRISQDLHRIDELRQGSYSFRQLLPHTLFLLYYGGGDLRNILVDLLRGKTEGDLLSSLPDLRERAQKDIETRHARVMGTLLELNLPDPQAALLKSLVQEVLDGHSD